MTPSECSKAGGFQLKELAETNGVSRQWLFKLYHSNREAFIKMLVKSMRVRCEQQIKHIESMTDEEPSNVQ